VAEEYEKVKLPKSERFYGRSWAESPDSFLQVNFSSQMAGTFAMAPSRLRIGGV
jgi:hypothetical protein